MSCGRPHETPCSQVVASLSAYIDGEVGAEEYRLIAVHLPNAHRANTSGRKFDEYKPSWLAPRRVLRHPRAYVNAFG